jgi:hypothetical protein
MPNGRPGDHDLTDILVHGFEIYGTEADDLIRKIAEHCNSNELHDWWLREIADETDRKVVLQKARKRFEELSSKRSA